MIKITAVLLLLFFSAMASAQSKDSLLRIYNTQTIYRVGDNYLKGHNKLTYRDLEYEFTSPITIELYKNSKKNMTILRVLQYTTFGFILVGASALKPSKKSAYILSGGMVVFGLSGRYFRKQSIQFLDKAIWQRNKEVLFGVGK